jgi:hypothetical protein
MTVFPQVPQAIANDGGTRQAIDEFFHVWDHGVQLDSSLQKLTTISRKLPGSSEG